MAALVSDESPRKRNSSLVLDNFANKQSSLIPNYLNDDVKDHLVMPKLSPVGQAEIAGQDLSNHKLTSHETTMLTPYQHRNPKSIESVVHTNNKKSNWSSISFANNQTNSHTSQSQLDMSKLFNEPLFVPNFLKVPHPSMIKQYLDNESQTMNKPFPDSSQLANMGPTSSGSSNSNYLTNILNNYFDSNCQSKVMGHSNDLAGMTKLGGAYEIHSNQNHIVSMSGGSRPGSSLMKSSPNHHINHFEHFPKLVFLLLLSIY